MGRQSNSHIEPVPGALPTALKRLGKNLRKNRKHLKPSEIIKTIEDFADAFCRCGGEDQLRYRAEFVKQQSGEGTAFRREMDLVIQAYVSQPKVSFGRGISAQKDADEKLRRHLDEDAPERLFYLEQHLDDFQRLLEQALREGIVTATNRSAFEALLARARQIGLPARQMECDGCFYIWHTYLAEHGGSSEESRMWRGFISSDVFGSQYFKKIRAAAKSLVSFFDSNSGNRGKTGDLPLTKIQKRNDQWLAWMESAPPQFESNAALAMHLRKSRTTVSRGLKEARNRREAVH